MNSERILKTFTFPILFLLLGAYCLVEFHEGFTVDGYFLINGSREILRTGTYTSYSAGIWPPTYPLLVSLTGLFLNLELSGKFVSLFAGVGFLALLPRLSESLGYKLWAGIVIQGLLVTSPSFLEVSLEAETHMLDAFFFVGTCLYGTKVLKKNKLNFIPWGFILFTVLASLTRYGSLVLIPGFSVAFFLRSDFEKETDWLLGVVGSCVALFSLWPLYNFSVNGFFLSGEKDAGALIGIGMAENKVVETNSFEWVHTGYFEFDSFRDILATYPWEYLKHVVENSFAISKLIILDYPPLGVFSILISFGILTIYFERSKPYNLFLAGLFCGYFPVVALLRFDWVYFLHLGTILSLAGMGFVFVELKRLNQTFTGSSYLYVIVIFFLAPVLFYQVKANWKEFESLRKNGFRHELLPTENVEQIVKHSITNRELNGQRTRLMASFAYLPNLYDSGFRISVAPLPNRSVDSFLCYGDLTPQQEKFYGNINFPPGLQLEEYVPPDYLIIDPVISYNISRTRKVNRKTMESYLRKLNSSRYYRGVDIYEVKKEMLNCSHSR